MNKYALNLTEVDLKEAVKSMNNFMVFYSRKGSGNVDVLTNENLPIAIINDCIYLISYGLQEV